MQEWSSPAAWSEDELPRVQDIELSGRTVSMRVAWNNVDCH